MDHLQREREREGEGDTVNDLEWFSATLSGLLDKQNKNSGTGKTYSGSNEMNSAQERHLETYLFGGIGGGEVFFHLLPPRLTDVVIRRVLQMGLNLY